MKKYQRESFKQQTDSLLHESKEVTPPCTPDELLEEELGKGIVKKIREYNWTADEYYDESNQEWVNGGYRSLKDFITDIVPNVDRDEQFWYTLLQEDVARIFLAKLSDIFHIRYSDFYLCLPDSLRQDESFLDRFTSELSLDPRELPTEAQVTFSQLWIKKRWQSSEQKFIGSKLANIPWTIFSEKEQKELIDASLQSPEGRLSFLENKKTLPSSVVALVDVRQIIQAAYVDVLDSEHLGLKFGRISKIYRSGETTVLEAGVSLKEIRLLYKYAWRESGDDLFVLAELQPFFGLKPDAEVISEDVIFDKLESELKWPSNQSARKIDQMLSLLTEGKRKTQILRVLDQLKKMNIRDHEISSVYTRLKEASFPIDLTSELESNIRQNLVASEFPYFIQRHYQFLYEYLGADKKAECLIWNYLGLRDRWELLKGIGRFVEHVKDYQVKTGRDQKPFVERLLQMGGMGTGNQAFVLRDIMGAMTSSIMETLEKESMYPDQSPPLRDIHTLNLFRLQNEIKLLETPEIRQAIFRIPPAQSKLKHYGLALMRHPTVKVDAVRQFIESPRDLFSSRSGEGEHNPSVDQMLTALSPENYPEWNAEQSRDALVEGVYDRLNAFKPVSVEWSDNSQMDELERNVQLTLSRYEGNDLSTKALLMFAQEQFTKFDGSSERFFQERYQAFVKDLFLDVISTESHKEMFFTHLQTKGENIIRLAYDFQEKRELTPFVARRRKILNNPRLEKKEEKLASLDAEEESIRVRIGRFRGAALDLLKHQTRNKEETLRRFWEEIFATGWVDDTYLVNLAKRMTGQAYESTQDWLAASVDTDLRLRNKLKEVISEMTKAVQSRAQVTWYRAAVLAPSDPTSATAGSTTGQCDAFGHGKKTNFLFNPGTAQLIFQESRQGKPSEWTDEHLVAQSTLTKDKLLFEHASQREAFIQALLENQGKIGPALRACGFKGTINDFLERYSRSPDQIGLDSVEVLPNMKERITPKKMHELFQHAFTRMSAKQPMYAAQAVVGMQYSYFNEPNLPRTENKGIWQTLIPYSDNPHMVSEAVLLQEGHSVVSQISQPDLRAARPEDAFALALMEQSAFERSAGEQYVTGFVHMTRELYASCLQTEHRGYPPLAFIHTKHTEEKTDYLGYLIAFERGQNEIYITDTATTAKGKGTGGKLLLALMRNVASDPRLNTKTITMDCRGTTSAQAIAHPSARAYIERMRFVDKTGAVVHFKIEGPALEAISGDGLYPFRFVPVKEEIGLEL
ncbi:hypothetical protein HYV70_04135 [Candidatus Uhrbacteria bacterium]|nr:hypothetical protein [Candidatus Uhrbacteria bacterium]